MEAKSSRLMSTARTCRKAVWRCIKSIGRIPSSCMRLVRKDSRQTKNGTEQTASCSDEMSVHADKCCRSTGTQTPGENETPFDDTVADTVPSDVRQVTGTSAVIRERQPKNKKAKRVRRKKGRPELGISVRLTDEQTPNSFLEADIGTQVEETPTTLVSDCSSNKEQQPCKNLKNVVIGKPKDGKNVLQTNERLEQQIDQSIIVNQPKGNKRKRIRRRKCRPDGDAPSTVDEQCPWNTDDVISIADKSGSVERTTSNHETKLSENPVKIVDDQSIDAIDNSKRERLPLETKQDESRSNNVASGSIHEAQSPDVGKRSKKAKKKSRSSLSKNNTVDETKSADTTKKSYRDMVVANPSGIERHSSLVPLAIVKSTVAEGAIISRKSLHDVPQIPNKESNVKRGENARVPATYAKEATSIWNKTGGATKREHYTTEKLNKEIVNILKMMTPENAATLTEHFAALPIDTMERLDNAVQLVFDKAVQNRYMVAIYGTFCTSLRSVHARCANSKTTTTFTSHMLKKCQKEFEAYKTSRTNSVKQLEEINSCKDPVKKRTLELRFNEDQRRANNRFIGNCRLIGEFFRQDVLKSKTVLYCVTDLISQRSEVSLDCACNILMAVGKELESCCDLNDTFEKLETLMSDRNIIWRIRCRIKDVTDLRKDKWPSEGEDQ